METRNIIEEKSGIYLGQLFGNVASHEHGLQIDPQILYRHPILDNVRRVGEFLHPLLDGFLEWRVVPL